MTNLRMARHARYRALLQRADSPRRPQPSPPLHGPGLGWGFVGRGSTFFGTVAPLGLVALLAYGAYRWGYYALKGRPAPSYEGVPHASKVWD